MATLNQCNFIGNVGHSPKLSTLESGKTVAKFSVAVNKKVKGVEKPLWINVSAWEHLAEIAHNYVRAGQPVFVSGEIDVRTYEKDGETKISVDLTARTLTLLGKKEEEEAAPPASSKANGKTATTVAPRADVDDLDEIPF